TKVGVAQTEGRFDGPALGRFGRKSSAGLLHDSAVGWRPVAHGGKLHGAGLLKKFISKIGASNRAGLLTAINDDIVIASLRAARVLINVRLVGVEHHGVPGAEVVAVVAD